MNHDQTLGNRANEHLLPMRQVLRAFGPCTLLIFATVGGAPSKAIAQTVVSVPPAAQPNAEQIAKMRAQAAANAKNNGKSSDNKEKKDQDKKKGDEKEEDKKKDDEVKTIKRPTDAPAPLDPNRMKLAPDASGRVQFNYNGYPWADVLQEFADAGGYSFDWQELPADFLNLTTRKKYTIPEARDLLNRHLLARGFTMIVQGEVLTVVKVDKLDPSLIPRVNADDLEDYAPHDFVRVRFKLPITMDPGKATEDVKILLSPNAKVKPLLATKRLLVIDTVANLRDVRDLLYSEQTAANRDRKPAEYPIRHRRADYVADQVMVVLGLDPSSRNKPKDELKLEQTRLQLFMQMQQKGKDVSKLLKKDGPKVFIAVNRRSNSVLVNAPPELMPIIDRTIKLLDVPDGMGLGTDSGPLTMEKYKTVTASTDSVITALKEIGNLDPLTQLQSDSESKTIYAYATPTDHAKIKKIIDKLDGSGRRATVVWLRRSPADQVAGTIMALLVGEKKKKKSRRRSFWDFGRSDDDEDDKPVGFKALADIENNRLLLWANEAEREEVNKLLIQLGEIPSGDSNNPSKVRVLEARDPAAAARLLRRLEKSYQLRIHEPEEKPDGEKSKPQEDTPATPAEEKDKVAGQPWERPPAEHRSAWSVQFAVIESDADTAPSDQQKSEPAAKEDDARQTSPIDVVVTEEGRIILRGDDPAVLDEIEDLLRELAPAQDDFHVFDLHNAEAYWVVLNLEEYFEDELKGLEESKYDIWGNYSGTKKRETGPLTLSKRPLLRFIYDDDTNTIVVQNASPSQLRTIQQLIDIYDRPPSEDSVAARRTEAIKIRYSRASDIATALKEVYRDLLSSKDKEFQGKDGQQKGHTTETHYRFYGTTPPEEGKKPGAVKIAFEGALSIGVDEVSNTLIISAQEEVWDNVRQIVKRLDQAAQPNTVVQVHEVRGFLSPQGLQKALSEALGQPWPGGKPAKQTSKQSGDGKNQKQEGAVKKGNGKQKSKNNN